MKADGNYPEKYDLSSLKVLGSVGEPINEEAWHWYHQKVGGGRCPIVDTWWQTENGAIMISSLAGVTPEKPGFATLPLPGVDPVIMDEEGNILEGPGDRKSTRLNSSHVAISYAVFCLKKQRKT